MLHTIYIVEKKSGRAIFSKAYFKIDETLISGFLSALYGFAQAELDEKSGVDNVDMSGNRFVYVDNGGLLYIGCADKNDSVEMLHEQLGVIKDSFKPAFSIPEEGGFDKLNWDGNVTTFRPFEETLDMIVQQWEKAKKVAKAGYMMDLIDVYQNTLQALAQFPEFYRLKEAGVDELDISKMIFEDGSADMERLGDIDENNIRENLNSIVQRIVTLLKGSMDNDTFIKRLNQFIFPFFKKDFARIKEAKADEFFIKLLL